MTHEDLARAVLAGQAIEVDHRNGVRCGHFPGLEFLAHSGPAPPVEQATPVHLVRMRVRRGGEAWQFEAGRCSRCGRVYVRGLRHLTVV